MPAKRNANRAKRPTVLMPAFFYRFLSDRGDGGFEKFRKMREEAAAMVSASFSRSLSLSLSLFLSPPLSLSLSPPPPFFLSLVLSRTLSFSLSSCSLSLPRSLSREGRRAT